MDVLQAAFTILSLKWPDTDDRIVLSLQPSAAPYYSNPPRASRLSLLHNGPSPFRCTDPLPRGSAIIGVRGPEHSHSGLPERQSGRTPA